VFGKPGFVNNVKVCGFSHLYFSILESTESVSWVLLGGYFTGSGTGVCGVVYGVVA